MEKVKFLSDEILATANATTSFTSHIFFRGHFSCFAALFVLLKTYFVCTGNGCWALSATSLGQMTNYSPQFFSSSPSAQCRSPSHTDSWRIHVVNGTKLDWHWKYPLQSGKKLTNGMFFGVSFAVWFHREFESYMNETSTRQIEIEWW